MTADKRPLARALAGFAVLCGLLLLWLGTDAGISPDGPPDDDANRDRPPAELVEALEAAQRAQSAIDAANYGEVRRHLDSLERSLTAALAHTSAPTL